MADQFDNTARSQYPDAEIDDPLAELARIIGYERPSEVTPAAEKAPESSEFDLEAELMRELDVPLAPSIDELDRIEADEALDVLMADGGFDQGVEQSLADADRNAAFDAQFDTPFDDAPALDTADFISAEGRSSDALLKAIESEFPVDQAAELTEGELSGGDDDWMQRPDSDYFAEEQPSTEPAPFNADEQLAFEPFAEEGAPAAAAAVMTPQAASADDLSGDDVFADMVRFDQRCNPPVGAESDDPSAVSDNTQPEGQYADKPLDFEEYLSAELDVFGQEVAISESSNDIEPSDQAAIADNGVDLDVETALDALNDSELDDQVAVFDDAAEELLAAINGDVENRSLAGPAQDHTIDPTGEWSLDSIEEGVADELDDELGDMFGLPERAPDPVAAQADATDELEIDLEQVLADGFDDDWAEPVEVVSVSQRTEPAVEANDWLSGIPEADQQAQRDEMTEAFLDFVPHDDDDGEPELASSKAGEGNRLDRPGAEPQQSDWLDGFETSEQMVEASSSASGADDYYFDAELISESDEMVEIVTDIDVPELEHDDPQLVDPDYDTEIEREFADIVEQNEQNLDDQPANVVGAALGSAEDWSRGTTPQRGYEVSDDYIALERELSSGVDHASIVAATAGYDGQGMVGEFDGPDAMAAASGETENGSRGPVLAIAVLGLAVLAGVGAFGWSMMSGDEMSADGGPRIIRADTDPVKVLPENPGGVTVPNQDKAVYDRVAGGGGASPGQPALINSAEEPVDVVQRTLDPEFLPLEGRADFAGKSEERLSADGTSGESTGDGLPAPVVSPRKVRTMIVKPDGSIVAREISEPEVSTAGDTPQTLAAASPESAATSDTAQVLEPAQETPSEAAAPVQEPAVGTDIAATDGTVAPVRVVKTQPIRPVANAPVPQGRPADQPVNVVGTVSQAGRVGAAPAAAEAVPATPAAPQPVAVASAPAAAAPVANPGGYYVQIASQPTAEGAQSSWRTLSNRYSSVLGGQSVDIQRADIPGKGVFHRVRVPAGSRDQANALCSRYKSAGGSCFVSR
ncbi:SPOR domain-containing protein [Hoeflea sp. AS60]|uniref:SPOR domain-containing protein n=1 Tax=Hoeflea sp. AS60 TaxID=3135780 RepID=UPI00317985F1